MRCSLLFLCAALFFTATTFAQTPSFSCSAAHTAREKAICARPEFAALDNRLATAYAAARKQLSPEAAAFLQADQRDWLAYSDKVCAAPARNNGQLPDCITRPYTARTVQLTQGLQRIDGTLFYTRAHFVFAPGNATSDKSTNNPGFGYGEFAWPQIDNPSPDQAVWNTAVSKAAVSNEATTMESRQPTFEAAVTSDCTLDGFFTIVAANDRFIDVNLGNSSYCGGAHGNTSITSFGWWLDQRHALNASDVFQSNSAWQQKLSALTQAALIKQYSRDTFWKDREFTDGVDSAVTDIGTWNPSSEGLTITFGSYAIAAYAFGMPNVTLPWTDLQALLAPGFHPTDLPHRLTPPN